MSTDDTSATAAAGPALSEGLGPNAQDVARESVDDALMIVESYGPWGADLNDAHRRQIVLADEVMRLRGLYEMAVRGRADMRDALRQERRAEELHECCQMPMEQARELAASEASPDWYARGQDWGLADALTNGQSGDWVLDDIARAFAAGAAAKTTMKVEISSDPEMLRRAMAAETEVALLRAALDQKHAEYEDLKRCAANNASNLALKLEAARRELAKVNNEFGSENADWPEAWRRVAEVKERAGRLWRDNETLRAALTVVVRDWTEQFERNGHLAPAWVRQAREALGPNVRANRPEPTRSNDE